MRKRPTFASEYCAASGVGSEFKPDPGCPDILAAGEWVLI
jgi:hypothetical protein